MTEMESAKKLIEEQEKVIEALEKGIEALKEAVDGMKDLRNCVNCCHYDKCVIVRQRRIARANDYSICEYWEA